LQMKLEEEEKLVIRVVSIKIAMQTFLRCSRKCAHMGNLAHIH
jgi:hypothetical protein